MSAVTKRYKLDESGATAIEYGLLAAMLTIALVAILSTGDAVQALYDAMLAVAESLDNARGGSGGDES